VAPTRCGVNFVVFPKAHAFLYGINISHVILWNDAGKVALTMVKVKK
jgi:hypothetical protein